MQWNGPRLFRTWIYPVLAVVVPTRCSGCGDLLGPRQHLGLCPDCWASLEPDRFDPRNPLQCSATRYSGLARQILLEAKFRNRPELFRPMALRMAAACRMAGLDRGLDLVVPVPSHLFSLVRRTYNPARELARNIARDLGLPLAGPLLRRKLRHYAPVKQANRETRRNESGSAFVAPPGRFRNRRVLLVDDILTTGATSSGCRSALLEAGAHSVKLLVWGRTPLESGRVAGERNALYNEPLSRHRGFEHEPFKQKDCSRSIHDRAGGASCGGGWQGKGEP
jgi:predicted amidophosphoribosyltransferase